MSPRTATTGALGSRPLSRATTPVLATRLRTAGLSVASSSWRRRAVRSSRSDSSGCRCRSRRSATSRSRRSGGKNPLIFLSPSATVIWR